MSASSSRARPIPRVPVRIDVREIPLVGVVDLGRDCASEVERRGHHRAIIAVPIAHRIHARPRRSTRRDLDATRPLGSSPLRRAERVVAALDEVQRGARQASRRAPASRPACRTDRACRAGTASARRSRGRCAVASLRRACLADAADSRRRRARPGRARSRCAAATCDAMRPPIDLPPANSVVGRSVACSRDRLPRPLETPSSSTGAAVGHASGRPAM